MFQYEVVREDGRTSGEVEFAAEPNYDDILAALSDKGLLEHDIEVYTVGHSELGELFVMSFEDDKDLRTVYTLYPL